MGDVEQTPDERLTELEAREAQVRKLLRSALERDVAASERDRAAQARDDAADHDEPTETGARRLREQSAIDRDWAARDRDAAAGDRADQRDS